MRACRHSGSVGVSVHLSHRRPTLVPLVRRYDEAVDRFVAAATMCRDDNMQKFNSPGHLLNAVLCWLCSGVRPGVARRVCCLPVCRRVG